jgi:hypothetical protein
MQPDLVSFLSNLTDLSWKRFRGVRRREPRRLDIVFVPEL